MTFPTQLSETPATGNPTRTNEALDTLHAFATYLKRHAATTGLTWAYWDGRWGGFAVAVGTLTLTDAADNYVVVLRSTGVISVSTSATNWNNTTDYARVYKITTAGSVVTAVEAHYAGPDGVHGGGDGGSGGAVDSVNGQTGTVVLDSFDIEHTDPLGQFGSPSTVGNALEELATGVVALETGHINGMIEEPEEKTYTLVLKSAYAFTILETTTDAATGSGTATFEIDGTPLGGSANSVTSTENSQTHGSANTVAVGQTLTVVMSAIGSPSLIDMSFSIRYTR